MTVIEDIEYKIERDGGQTKRVLLYVYILKKTMFVALLLIIL